MPVLIYFQKVSSILLIMNSFILTKDLQGQDPNSPHQFVELLKGKENNKTIYSIELSKEWSEAAIISIGVLFSNASL